MGNFKKIKDNLYICEECGKICGNKLRGLSRHITNQHKNLSKKEYYDKWVKDYNEGQCKICGKESIFRNLQYAYNVGCCKKHIIEYNQQQIKKAVKEKYGVDNVFMLKEVKEKIISTNLKLYGVEHNHQDFKILEKSFKTGLKIKMYNTTNIWYQGSYELDFLENFYNNFTIHRGPSIKYNFNEKDKIYFPDFYIPSLNLIIECKSTYYYNLHKLLNEAKKLATFKHKYNYCLILDKNYDDFNLLIHSL
jgi:hypothetical protein